MIHGKHLGWLFVSSLTLLGAGCSSGGSGGANVITAAVQDLTLDPDGLTTVLTFASDSGLALATTAHFAADGGQTAQAVVVAGDMVTITWDQRVTPSHQVQALALSGISAALHAVTTSDASAPTFTITDGQQTPGLGGDVIEVTFAGPRVVETLAEDLANWTLEIGGTALDLTGSTIDLDVPTQVLTITLGTSANLHAAFDLSASGLLSVADVAVGGGAVAGVASGDAVAPALLGAVQNLGLDEYGRIVDFTFDEAMDPVFSVQLAHFDALPDVAISVARPAEEVLRVTFSGPIIPGVQDIDLIGLVDAHGNAFPDGPQGISQPTPVANNLVSGAATTVPNAGNDTIVVETTQAFDPDAVVDPANWVLLVDGNPVDLSTQTVAYDFTGKELSITLTADMQNGDAWSLTPQGAGILEIDGQHYTTVIAGNAAGDATAPVVSQVTQNRIADPSGRTLDVSFTEDLDLASAQTLGNFVISGAQTIQTATRLAGLKTVRLTFDDVVVPGDVTLTVDGVADLAGNPMAAPMPGLALVSTDVTAPAPVTALAEAVEGADDDTLRVTFSDDMVVADITDPANWACESPTGFPRSTLGATVSYSVATRTATLTFTNGESLQQGDDFSVTFAGARDLGGNTITGAVLPGFVAAETNLPELESLWLDALADELVLRFSEPCGNLDDLVGTQYVLRTGGGVLRGSATTATVIDGGLGVRVGFGQVIAPTDTLDVQGVTDLAGNPLFALLAVPCVAEDAAQPSLAVGFSTVTTVSGESNDVVTLVFDRALASWDLLDPAHYTLTDGVTPVDLSGATFAFDGLDTVTITLPGGTGHDLRTGTGYDLSVVDVRSVQGVLRSVADTELGIPAAGDGVGPAVLIGRVRIDPTTADSLLVEFDEAVDPVDAVVLANYDYDGGNLATSVTLLGPRTVRATFAVTPAVGFDLDVTVDDRAGNTSGLITRAVAAADAAAPLISSVAGQIGVGYGGDRVVVEFGEPVTSVSALDVGHYVVQTGATTLDLTGAVLTYASATNRVTIHLPAGQELVDGAALTVTIDDVEDHSGNAIGTPIGAGGLCAGDAQAPDFAAAFVNYRVAPAGTAVDVRFDEDVPAAFVETTGNWTATGGVNVIGAEAFGHDHVRLTLDAALPGAATVQLVGLPDFAGNVSGAIAVDPQE